MAEQNPSIHPETSIGVVSLTVPNLSRSMQFYRQIIGLDVLQEGEGTARLGPAGGSPVLELVENSGAQMPKRSATGLYHFALRVPSRKALARTLHHLAQSSWPLQGASDHLVSEALYLADPDGNGIEIYRDRPRDEWPFQDDQLLMSTEALDVEGLIGELEADEESWSGLPTGSDMGHIHLKVSSIPAAERFYVDVLGFDLMTRYGPSASFVSAGGYHHHIGFNTWISAGSSPPAPDAAGLRYYEILFLDTEALEGALKRMRQNERPLECHDKGYRLQDPAGNGIQLAVR